MPNSLMHDAFQRFDWLFKVSQASHNLRVSH